MHPRPLCVLLLLAVVCAATASLASPASATLTPVSVRFSATTTGARIVDQTNGDVLACPTSELTATIDPDALGMSVRITMSRSASATCTMTVRSNPISAVVSFVGNITLPSFSSTAGTMASGDALLDNNSAIGITTTFFGTSASRLALGPQTTPSGWTFSQATQVLTLDIGIRTHGRPTVTLNLRASYRFLRRLTIS